MRAIAAGTVLALLALTFTNAQLFSDPPASEKPADKADPYVVPEGSAAELVDYLKGLAQVKPTNAAEGKKMREALIKAADGIIADDPTEQQLAMAVSAKMQALSDNLEKLAAFADELKKDGHESHAHQVQVFSLVVKLQADPLTKGNLKERTKELVDCLCEQPINTRMEYELFKNADRMAELTGDTAFAVKMYRKLQEALVKSANSQIANLGKSYEGKIRRMELPGNTMKIEGDIFGGNGGKFDWANYKDKVVLVNFFATWCGPCRKEIEGEIKEAYKLYHDKGFDIVGISLDRNKESLAKFIKDKELPWTILYGDNKPSPTVGYYGVSGIPQLILVGKDGKVISLNVRGHLVKELEKLLGPVEEGQAAKLKKPAHAKVPDFIEPDATLGW